MNSGLCFLNYSPEYLLALVDYFIIQLAHDSLITHHSKTSHSPLTTHHSPLLSLLRKLNVLQRDLPFFFRV
jgi:hypothetical protein